MLISINDTLSDANYWPPAARSAGRLYRGVVQKEGERASGVWCVRDHRIWGQKINPASGLIHLPSTRNGYYMLPRRWRRRDSAMTQ